MFFQQALIRVIALTDKRYSPSMSYLDFLIIASIAAFTPGPNNSMLMQSGIYFGLRGTIRHIGGIIIGFSFLFFCINMGIYALVNHFPVLSITLKSIGTVYFTYLAYRMITMAPPVMEKNSPQEDDSGGQEHRRLETQSKPLGFWGAFFFQWINIKAWFFALSATATLPTTRTIHSILIAQMIILLVSTGSTLTWTMGGVFISKVLKKPLHLRIISVILALSLMYITIEQWL